MGALYAGADEIGLGVDNLDGPPPVVVLAALAGFVGEVAFNYLECPQGIAPKNLVGGNLGAARPLDGHPWALGAEINPEPKLLLVAYFAGVMQDS